MDATPDPYADCRLAIAVHELMYNDLKKLFGFAFWEANVRSGISPDLCLKGLLHTVDQAINSALIEPQFAGIDRDEVKRQMRQPSFLQWIAGNLGAV